MFLISNTQQSQPGRNSAFVNDANGVVLYANQGAGTGTGRIQNLAGGYLCGSIGDYSNPGHVQRQFVVNGEVLARYGDAPDPAATSSSPGYISTPVTNLDNSLANLRGVLAQRGEDIVASVDAALVDIGALRDPRSIPHSASLGWLPPT